MRSIGIYGGTFNPPHLGHIDVAIKAKKACALDEVWFSPAYQNPLKEKESVEPRHRLEMVKLLVEDIPYFSVNDWEIQRETLSYTIEAVEQFEKEAEGARFHLIMGSDTAVQFEKFKDADRLLTKVVPLVALREEAHREKIPPGFMIIADKTYPISSSLIRQEAKTGYIGHMVPPNILCYMRRHRLYSLG